MRVFVTGAGGLIGSLVCDALIKRGDEVIGLSRHSRAAASKDRFQWVQGDPAIPGEWQQWIPEVDAVVHLAGESIAARRWTTSQKEKLFNSRVRSTQVIAGAIQRSEKRPSVFVGASAVGFYGDRGDEILDEASAPGSDFLSQLCQAWEAASVPIRGAGVRAVSLRFGVVLSSRGGALPRMLLPFRFFIGGPVGSPTNWFPWIHERDAAGLILFALEKSLSGPLNAVSPGLVQAGTFAKTIGDILRRPAIVSVPAFVLKIALGKMAEAVTGSQRANPRAALASGYRFEFESLRAALKETIS